jgi:DHA3 family macrolide efflux protein-like MFS transporter
LVAVPELKKASGGTDEPKHFFGEMLEGARAYLQNRKLAWVSLALMLAMLAFIPLAMLYPLITSDYFKLSAWHGSVIEFVYAAAMMLGSALTPRFAKQRELSFAQLSVVLMGIAAVATGALPASFTGYVLFVPLCLAMGLANGAFSVSYNTYLQKHIPLEKQGRAFSFFGTCMSFAMPIGLLVVGPIAERAGVLFWFYIGGAATTAIMAASWFLTRKLPEPAEIEMNTASPQ